MNRARPEVRWGREGRSGQPCAPQPTEAVRHHDGMYRGRHGPAGEDLAGLVFRHLRPERSMNTCHRQHRARWRRSARRPLGARAMKQSVSRLWCVCGLRARRRCRRRPRVDSCRVGRRTTCQRYYETLVLSRQRGSRKQHRPSFFAAERARRRRSRHGLEAASFNRRRATGRISRTCPTFVRRPSTFDHAMSLGDRERAPHYFSHWCTIHSLSLLGERGHAPCIGGGGPSPLPTAHAPHVCATIAAHPRSRPYRHVDLRVVKGWPVGLDGRGSLPRMRVWAIPARR